MDLDDVAPLLFTVFGLIGLYLFFTFTGTSDQILLQKNVADLKIKTNVQFDLVRFLRTPWEQGDIGDLVVQSYQDGNYDALQIEARKSFQAYDLEQRSWKLELYKDGYLTRDVKGESYGVCGSLQQRLTGRSACDRIIRIATLHLPLPRTEETFEQLELRFLVEYRK